MRTRGREGVALFEYALKALQAAPSSDATELALGRVLARLGWFYTDIGLPERAATTCDKAIHILRPLNSPEDLLTALYGRQNIADTLREYDVGVITAQEGVNLARSNCDSYWEGYLLGCSGWASFRYEDFASALKFAEDALSIFNELGDHWGSMFVFVLLGEIKLQQNEYEVAKQWFQQVQPLAEAFGHLWNLANLHATLGRFAIREHRYTAARREFTRALKLLWDGGYAWTIHYPLIQFAQIFADLNELDRAVAILATVHKHQAPFVEPNQRAQTLRDELQSKLEAERFAAAWARGEGQTLSALVVELLAEFAQE